MTIRAHVSTFLPRLKAYKLVMRENVFRLKKSSRNSLLLLLLTNKFMKISKARTMAMVSQSKDG